MVPTACEACASNGTDLLLTSAGARGEATDQVTFDLLCAGDDLKWSVGTNLRWWELSQVV